MQLQHFCNYELGFSFAFRGEWGEVESHFTRLHGENSWSKVHSVGGGQPGREWCAQ